MSIYNIKQFFVAESCVKSMSFAVTYDQQVLLIINFSRDFVVISVMQSDAVLTLQIPTENVQMHFHVNKNSIVHKINHNVFCVKNS